MQWASVFGMRLDETHSQDEESRSQERKRVQNENGIASEQRCYCPAKGRADHQVEGPGGRGQSVREDYIFTLDDVRDHGTASRLEKGGQQRFGYQQRIDQPDHFFRTHEEHDEHASEVGGNHDVFAAQAIVDYPGGGTDERLWQDLQDQSQGNRAGTTRKLQQQVVDGQRVEPIANFADNLRA